MSPDLSDFHPEPGWVGQVLRVDAEGALPAGTTVVKVNSEPGDGTPEGTKGTVLGSIDAPREVYERAALTGARPPDRFVYNIEWRNRPRHAVTILDWKIKEKR